MDTQVNQLRSTKILNLHFHSLNICDVLREKINHRFLYPYKITRYKVYRQFWIFLQWVFTKMIALLMEDLLNGKVFQYKTCFIYIGEDSKSITTIKNNRFKDKSKRLSFKEYSVKMLVKGEVYYYWHIACNKRVQYLINEKIVSGVTYQGRTPSFARKRDVGN